MEIYRIPIINYHKVEPQRDVGLTSRRPVDFCNDMRLLANLGYTSLTFRDISILQTWPAKPIIITFDDGYESVYHHALPVMKAYGFKGVVFIPAGYIGRDNDWDVQFGNKRFKHLSLSQLKVLVDDGFEIGSHGISHRPFTALDEERLYQELSESKYILHEITETPVITICYPFGRFNNRIIRAVNACGYRFGLASLHYRKIKSQQALYKLRRFNIYRHDRQASIEKKIGAAYNSPLAWRDWLIQKGGYATSVYQLLKEKPLLDPVNLNYMAQELKE